MIQKGDLRIALQTIPATFLPGLTFLAFTLPDMIPQATAMLSVLYISIIGAALMRRATRATYHHPQEETHA